MKAIFEVTSVSNQWKPPFAKKKEVNEYTVEENQSFEDINMNGVAGKVFTVKAIRDGKALVKYDKNFMAKGYGEDPMQKEKWATEGNMMEFSFLWGENGVTKRLLLKKVEP